MHIARYAYFLLLLTPPAGAADAWQDPQSIRDAVIAFAQRQAEPDTRYEITVDAVDSRIRLPKCGNSLDVRGNNNFKPIGTATVVVRCNAAQGWMTYVPIRIKAFRKLAVLANPVLRGSVLHERDIVLREFDLGTFPNGYFASADAVVGKTAKRSLVSGTVLSPTMLAAARWVTRGDLVTLLIDAGGLQVRAQGEALADGSESDQIKARNVITGKIVNGHVVGPGILRVRL